MNYTVWLSPHAQRRLDRLHGKAFDLVQGAIDRLTQDPRPRGCLKLKGRTNQWRLRAGTYRIIYTIDDTARLVSIVEVDHRRDVYDA